MSEYLERYSAVEVVHMNRDPALVPGWGVMDNEMNAIVRTCMDYAEAERLAAEFNLLYGAANRAR